MSKNWGSFISSGQVMSVGDYLTSPNGIFVAMAQADSNFVVYSGTRPGSLDLNQPVWGMPRGGLGNDDSLQPREFNFSLTDEAVWQSVWKKNSKFRHSWPELKKCPKGQYFAALEDDGNFAVYQGTGPTDKKQKMWETGNRDPVVDFVDISSIDYDVAAAKIRTQGTSDLYRSTLHNKTETQQTHAFHGSAAVTETSGWSNALMGKVGLKTNFKAGIPVLAEGKVEVSLEVQDTYTWNGSNTKTVTYSFDQPLVIPPHKTYTAIVKASVSTITVPYSLKGTAVLKSGKKVEDVYSKGVYTGTNAHDWNVDIEEEKDSRDEKRVAVSIQELEVMRKVASH